MQDSTKRGGYVRGLRLITAALITLGVVEQLRAQPYVTFYEGPGYDFTTDTGYTSPGFRFIPSVGDASTGRLLNEAGTATWYANAHPPVQGPLRPLRWNPLSGSADELGTASGMDSAQSFAINDDETVVGFTTTTFGSRAVRWNAGSAAMSFLAEPANYDARAAYDINDAGVIVGYAEKYASVEPFPSVGYRAMRWDAAGNPQELVGPASTQGPDSRSDVQAVAINESNVVVGDGIVWSGATNRGTRGIRWNAAGVATELGHLGVSASGVTTATAWAINSAGDAIGTADKYDAMGDYVGTRAVLWSASSTVALELEVLGADSNGISGSKVFAINDAGFSVGRSLKYEGDNSLSYHAVRWNAAGQVTELGHLPGGFETGEAHDINEAGIAVGQAARPFVTGGSEDVAVYWDASGNAVDLNTLIAPRADWVLRTAWAISDSGWILGEGSRTVEGISRVFMLQLPSPIDGDFDGDGDVDGRDFLIWQRNPSVGDLADWQANYGVGSLVASSVAVPEPGSIVAVMFGLWGVTIRRYKGTLR